MGRVPLLGGVTTVPGAQQTQTHLTVGIEVGVEPVASRPSQSGAFYSGPTWDYMFNGSF